MILHIIYGIGLFILACSLTIIAAIKIHNMQIWGFAALCWGLLLLVYYNYRNETKNELKKKIYGDKKKPGGK